MSRKLPVYFDVEHLVHAHVSGVGQYTAGLLAGLDRIATSGGDQGVSVGTWMRWLPRLEQFDFPNLRRRNFPVPIRVSGVLKRSRLLPPIDLMMGRAVYLFPNYNSWPTVVSPSVPFIYDLSYIHCPEFVDPANREFLEKQVPLSIKRASKVLTISDNSRNEIIDQFKMSEDRVFTCTPGVDPARFYRRCPDEITQVKARYGITGNYMLFVSNIEPRKGLLQLLKAYERLDQPIRDEYPLLLVGSTGWLNQEIIEEIMRLRIAGNRIMRPDSYVSDADLPALYSGARLLCYPSLYEGFGLPPIEAMACGTPVITSNNSSLPEAVGEAAIMVDPHDIDELSDAITRTLTDEVLREALIERGHRHAPNFCYENSALQLLAEIAELR